MENYRLVFFIKAEKAAQDGTWAVKVSIALSSLLFATALGMLFFNEDVIESRNSRGRFNKEHWNKYFITLIYGSAKL